MKRDSRPVLPFRRHPNLRAATLARPKASDPELVLTIPINMELLVQTVLDEIHREALEQKRDQQSGPEPSED